MREGQSNTDSLRGKLRLASFDQPQRLQKDGTSTYMPPAGMQRTARRASARRAGQRSRNRTCSSVVEMTRMVEVTRTYTQIASMLQQQSDMRRTAIEKLAEVPNA